MSLPRVLILAGGFGTRLASVVKDRPKPMALIQGRPLLEYQIEYLRNQGFSKFTLLTGHMSDFIENHFGTGQAMGVDITYSVETSPLGTGGAIRQAMEKFDDRQFLVTNGDGLFATDYRRFIQLAQPPLALALKFSDDLSRYGSVDINEEYRITRFREKTAGLGEGFINAGVYLVDREALAGMPQGKFSIETEVFQPLAEKHSLSGIPCGGKFIDIGTPDSFDLSQSTLPQWMFERFRPCLFLDRDGVLIRHIPYMHKVEEIELIPETLEMIRLAHGAGWWCVVVTNQAGVARGYFQPEDCEKVHAEIDRQLTDQGLHLDGWFSCFHHPEGSLESYRRESVNRKPGPGMLLQACEKLPIDLRASMMIGDNATDQIQLPDLQTLLIQGDFKLESIRRGNRRYENFSDLLAAVKTTISDFAAK